MPQIAFFAFCTNLTLILSILPSLHSFSYRVRTEYVVVCYVGAETLFHLSSANRLMHYRTSELIEIGKRVQNINKPSDQLIIPLESFDLHHEKADEMHYSKVLVRNYRDWSSDRVCQFLSDFFRVFRQHVNVVKESCLKKEFVCLVEFTNFDHCIHFENIVLPHNLTLLNRVNRHPRAKNVINFHPLITVHCNNVLNEVNSRDFSDVSDDIVLPCDVDDVSMCVVSPAAIDAQFRMEMHIDWSAIIRS